MSEPDSAGLIWSREPGFSNSSHVARITDAPGTTIHVRRWTEHFSVGFRQHHIATQLTFRLPSRGARLLLLREGTFRAWLRRFGYQDIQIGHADFDFRFVVKGQDEAAIRALLLPAATPLLDAVDYLSRVECDGTTMTMTAELRSANDYRSLPLDRLVGAMRALALSASRSAL